MHIPDNKQPLSEEYQKNYCQLSFTLVFNTSFSQIQHSGTPFQAIIDTLHTIYHADDIGVTMERNFEGELWDYEMGMVYTSGFSAIMKVQECTLDTVERIAERVERLFSVIMHLSENNPALFPKGIKVTTKVNPITKVLQHPELNLPVNVELNHDLSIAAPIDMFASQYQYVKERSNHEYYLLNEQELNAFLTSLLGAKLDSSNAKPYKNEENEYHTDSLFGVTGISIATESKLSYYYEVFEEDGTGKSKPRAIRQKTEDSQYYSVISQENPTPSSMIPERTGIDPQNWTKSRKQGYCIQDGIAFCDANWGMPIDLEKMYANIKAEDTWVDLIRYAHLMSQTIPAPQAEHLQIGQSENKTSDVLLSDNSVFEVTISFLHQYYAPQYINIFSIQSANAGHQQYLITNGNW